MWHKFQPFIFAITLCAFSICNPGGCNKFDEDDPVKLTPHQETYRRIKCDYLNFSNEELELYRVDEGTSKCYSVELGGKGPCGPNMRFYEKPGDPVHGICDCDQDSKRALIYHQETFQCYPIFTQAYCTTGTWLTLDKSTGQPICGQNPCKSLQIQSPVTEYVLYDNKCAILGSNCTNRIGDSNSNEEHGFLDFVPDAIHPKCMVFEKDKVFRPTTRRPYEGDTIFKPINKLKKCKPGSWRSISGACQGHYVW